MSHLFSKKGYQARQTANEFGFHLDRCCGACYAVYEFGEYTVYEYGEAAEVGRLKIPEVLTEEEQQALLAVPNSRYPTGQRNHAMLRLMLDAGHRVGELVAQRWRDIDLGTGKLHIKNGKGARDRVLWINNGCLEILQSWRERQAAELGAAPDHVFTTLDGKPLSTRYVQQMVKRYRERAGLAKQVTPHTLRHTYATDLLRQTKNIRLVQKALGHASLQNTQIYTHIVDDELEDALRSFRVE